MTAVTEEAIWGALDRVMDPEIPVISLVEMGIVRHVDFSSADHVTVTMAPTFSGCPALTEMETEIRKAI